MVRDYQKKRSGGKGEGFKGHHDVRDSTPFDNEPMAHRMERKCIPLRHLEEKIQNAMKNVELEKEDEGDQEKNLDVDDKTEGVIGSSKGLLGNPGTILKEIGILKQQMQFFGKEVEQVSKIARGEHTLGQHINQLLEVIGNVEEVKNFKKKIPQLKAKYRVLEKVNSDNQGKVSRLEVKLGNMEKMFKQIADNNRKSLKAMEIMWEIF